MHPQEFDSFEEKELGRTLAEVRRRLIAFL